MKLAKKHFFIITALLFFVMPAIANASNPQINSPSEGAITSELYLSFNINATHQPGSLQVVLVGNTTITITLDNLAVGAHEIVIDLDDVAASDGVTATSAASIPDDTYAITLRHNDITGATLLFDTVEDVTFDTVVPELQTLTPLDNAVDVPVNTNLTLVFDELVGWAAGNILIKKSSDDSVVQTIPVGGGPVSGSGTNTLVINPATNLAYNTSYYIEIPTGALRDLPGNDYAGFIGATTWNFTTLNDVTAPIITESRDLPDSIGFDDSDTYYFQSNELCEILVDVTSSSNEVSPLAEHLGEINQNVGILLSGMIDNGVYSYDVSCRDDAGNVSNILSVGPFRFHPAVSSGSGGGGGPRKKTASLPLVSVTPPVVAPATVPIVTEDNVLPIRDLEITMTGTDVKALQQLLNAQGFVIAEQGAGSPGNETEYFGALTQKALIAYQIKNAINPSAGYFGPITRAHMKSSGVGGVWW